MTHRRDPATYRSRMSDRADKPSLNEGKTIEIPEEQHQEEVARHPFAWLVLTAKRAEEDRA